MKLKLKEDPKEWRKVTILSAIPIAILSAVLYWRHKLTLTTWIVVLVVLLGIAICAWVSPRWFRGYYRASSRVGFALSQFIGCLLLAAFFLLVLTPLGLILRLCGKDFLRLKRPANATTYWSPTKTPSPLDRLF
jgi:uncharacterized membrane protein YfcA